MAATVEATAHSSAADRPTSAVGAWLAEPKNRYIALGGAVAAIALVTWVVVVSGQRKEAYAAKALDDARAVAESGNFPQAAADFQKISTTFGGTKAAQEAVIGLNQVRLLNNQSELAAVGLQDFLKSSPDAEFLPPAQGLLGRALEDAKRPGEAAKAYLDASRAADDEYLKADYLVDAARAYVSAGEVDKAIESLRKVLKDYPKVSAKTEAQVRLAELTKGAM